MTSDRAQNLIKSGDDPISEILCRYFDYDEVHPESYAKFLKRVEKAKKAIEIIFNEPEPDEK